MPGSPTIWDPYLQKDINKIENIQKRAARFIKHDYRSRESGSMTAMLEELGLPSLEARRKETRLCLIYTISNGLVPAIPPTDYFNPMRNRKIRAKRCGDCRVWSIKCFNQAPKSPWQVLLEILPSREDKYQTAKTPTSRQFSNADMLWCIIIDSFIMWPNNDFL